MQLQTTCKKLLVKRIKNYFIQFVTQNIMPAVGKDILLYITIITISPT